MTRPKLKSLFLLLAPQWALFLCVFFLLFLGAAAEASVVSGFGLFAVEESDDRQRPGVALHLGINGFESRLFYYGRSYGPVLEETSLLTLASHFPVPLLAYLSASVGLALLSEKTQLNFTDLDAKASVTEVQYNAGMLLGLNMTFLVAKSWQTELGWQSAIFPAGINGGLLLATARKQFLFVSMGYTW